MKSLNCDGWWWCKVLSCSCRCVVNFTLDEGHDSGEAGRIPWWFLIKQIAKEELQTNSSQWVKDGFLSFQTAKIRFVPTHKARCKSIVENVGQIRSIFPETVVIVWQESSWHAMQYFAHGCTSHMHTYKRYSTLRNGASLITPHLHTSSTWCINQFNITSCLSSRMLSWHCWESRHMTANQTWHHRHCTLFMNSYSHTTHTHTCSATIWGTIKMLSVDILFPHLRHTWVGWRPFVTDEPLRQSTHQGEIHLMYV